MKHSILPVICITWDCTFTSVMVLSNPRIFTLLEIDLQSSKAGVFYEHIAEKPRRSDPFHKMTTFWFLGNKLIQIETNYPFLRYVSITSKPIISVSLFYRGTKDITGSGKVPVRVFQVQVFIGRLMMRCRKIKSYWQNNAHISVIFIGCQNKRVEEVFIKKNTKGVNPQAETRISYSYIIQCYTMLYNWRGFDQVC